MNPVSSLSRQFPCDAKTLFAALRARDDWWGEGAPGVEVKLDPPSKITLEIEVAGAPTRAMLLLTPLDHGTELQVIQARFVDGETRDVHAALWEERLARLGARLG